MLVKLFSAAGHGVDASTIVVEVNAGGMSSGKISYWMVGLLTMPFKEGYQRIQSAIKISDIKFPRVKLVINFAPADIRKEGSYYDLPIALGILAAPTNFRRTFQGLFDNGGIESGWKFGLLKAFCQLPC